MIFKISKVFGFLIFFVLIMTAVSCQNDVNVIWPEERDRNKVSITLDTEYAHNREGFLYPGEIATFESRSVFDASKTVVWTFSQNSVRELFLESEFTDGGVSSIEKVFQNEGTYKIRADLYNSEDYKSLGVGAPLLDTDERQFTVEAIDLEIETAVVEERVIQFTPEILNPEIGPVYTKLRMYFGDGTMEAFEEINPEGTTHTYQSEGIYNITAELLFKKTDENSSIAKADTSVRVTGSLYIVTPSGILETDTNYTFQAHQVEKIPSGSTYRWDFGDGAVLKIPYTNEVTHLFVKPGSYVVTVDLLDSEVLGENILSSTYLPVEVEESQYFLDELHEMNKFDLDFTLHHDYTDLASGIFVWDWDSPGELTWDGTHFSMEWSQNRDSEYMIGKVSDDGTTIEHLIIRHEFLDNDRAQTRRWYELVIHDLPFSLDEAPDRFTANKRGEELQNFVTYFNTYETEGYHWTKDAELNIRLEKE